MDIKKIPEIGILPEDTKFTDSLDAGDPDCLCSRCGKVIAEDDIPIRVWPEGRNCELRYHLRCIFPGPQQPDDIGLEISLDPEEDL